MQLLFLWVENYKGLGKAGFHFTSEIRFLVQEDSGRRISIEKVEEHNPFLFKPPVLDITAIIGNNGSGKSTVLDLIKELIPSGQGSSERSFLAAFRKGGESKIIHVFLNHLDQFNWSDETEFEVQTHSWQNRHQVLGEVPSVAFYSNDFNTGKSNEEEVSGLINLSTNYLIRNEYKLIANDDFTDMDPLSGHVTSEYLRNFRFLISNWDSAQFPLPNELEITDLALDVKYFLQDSEKGYSHQLRGFAAPLHQLEQSVRSFKDRIAISLFCNHVRSHTSNSLSPFPFESLRLTLNESLSKNGNPAEPFRVILQAYDPFLTENNKIFQDRETINHIRNFLLTVERFLIDGTLKTMDSTTNVVRMKVSRENLSAMETFISLYSKAASLSSFVEMKWRNLSSGEQSRLTMFSRIYSLVDPLKRPKQELQKSILLLLDEADVGFHPEWQRTLLQELIIFLERILADRQVQIILAANSPFITSDLPRTKIIFLKKDDHDLVGNTQIPYQNVRPTFGSNIHLLLGSGFYMKDFMGEFARLHIQSAFNLLGKSEISHTDVDIIRKTIISIGEPVLRDHMEDLLFKKIRRATMVETIEEGIRILNEKKNRLLSGASSEADGD